MTEQEDPPEVIAADVTGDNVDQQGVAHACGITADGDEYCLGCSRTWPCADAIRLRVETLGQPVDEPTPELVVAQSVSTGLPWQLVADQVGVPRDEVQALLDAGA